MKVGQRERRKSGNRMAERRCISMPAFARPIRIEVEECLCTPVEHEGRAQGAAYFVAAIDF